MSDSMLTGLNSYYTTASSNSSAAAVNKTKDSLSGINKETTEEELRDAVKSFETYFVEQVLKEVKETTKFTDKESSSVSQMTDYFMDTTMTTMAEQLVDELGGTLTDQWVDSLKRNYGIE